jgi:TetR/AcrR family transcriptional repressor of nem operon
MSETSEQKSATRERILQCARRLFNRRGFVEVSIDEVMAEAGLTRGGFYYYFTSKEDLYAEAILQFARNDPPEGWRTVGGDPSDGRDGLARSIVNAYLSRDHLDDRDGSCPMVGLPSDTARATRSARAAFQQVVEMMVGAFESSVGPSADPPRERALALVALCVGGMVLARAVAANGLAEELRGAAHRQALRALDR